MPNALELLRRFDRYELADNRMTLYAPGFGLGSVHYWDGSWDNDEDDIPYQSREVFENRDGDLEVVGAQGHTDRLLTDRHVWQPHQIELRSVGSHHTVWHETKAIHRDVAVDLIRVSTSGLTKREVTVRHRIDASPALQIEYAPSGVHLFATRGRYVGIHRFIGFSGNSPVRLKQLGGGATLEITLSLPAEGNFQFAYIIACGEDRDETLQRYNEAREAPAAFIEDARRRWEYFFNNQVPEFECDVERWTKLYYFSAYVLRANLYDFQKGAIANPYSCPSKWRLLPSWFWDPCFHGFSEKWFRDYPAPLSTFRNHIGCQSEAGYLPMTLDQRGDTWKALGSSKSVCQQFVHPMTVWDHYLVHGDKSTLHEMIEPLARHDRYIGAHREVDNLFVPEGGGELADNSSRLVGDIGAREKIGTLSHAIRPVDWNTFQYIAERLIARMASEIGRDDLAREMQQRADAKLTALCTLWNVQTGTFTDRVLPSGNLSDKRFAETFVSLLGGYPDREQAQSLVATLTDPQHFWTRYPVPSLPLSDPSFTAEDCYASYWNGRGWPQMNWCYIEGLCRAGQDGVARQLLHRTLEMFTAAGEAHCMENFNPLNATSYAPPHCIFNQGWGAVGFDLILRRGLGIQINAARNEVSFAPLGLPGVREASMRGVPIGRSTLDAVIAFPDEGAPDIRVEGNARQVPQSSHWLEL